MAASHPLKGLELLDCAKSNAEQGVAIAAHQCGYGSDIEGFARSLKRTCEDIGVDIESLGDLITPPDRQEGRGLDIAPDSTNIL
ncbi:hypothetical protein XM38_010520 [Halomicronema hongdechloris C2206]|uniref:Uncharacterized protein n=1 Tax=Halomicronema hongdechloris C2206 TaxID=1641165 RepID=A0A1Z3HIH2_9CYAN|nr:hypothetical protein [Halomicronema hongdechloris]ASC70122.1 hypothetical protein XM38_010520 [Halomicronema hongdechloris C2206]